jgi:hypothetical protein
MGNRLHLGSLISIRHVDGHRSKKRQRLVVLAGDDLGKIENVLIEFSMPPSQSNNCEPGNSCMIESRELDVDDVS